MLNKRGAQRGALCLFVSLVNWFLAETDRHCEYAVFMNMHNESKSASTEPDQPQNQREPVSEKARRTDIGFALFMLTLTALFAYLGVWQVNRLAQKQLLISAVEERLGQQPISLPPVQEWVGFDAQTYDFRPLGVTGTFDHQNTVLVFTYLAEQRGKYSGPGYWVVAPFMLKEGGTVFVNRGFVPEAMAEEFKDGGAGPLGEQTITGLGRTSEIPNSFTPGSQFSNRIEWVRNIDRLLRFVDKDLGPVAPIYINADAGDAQALPQGGETRVSFINRHYEYALTWFSLAVLTPVMLIFWVWQSRRKRRTNETG